MRRFRVPFLILLLLALPYSVQGQTLRIGIVDFQKALDECEAGKNARAELEKIFRGKEKVLADQREEIKNIQDTLEKQATMLSPDALNDKKRDLAVKNREFQRNYNDFVDEMKLREKDLRDPILRELERIVKEIGEKGKYTLVVHKDKSVIIYSADTIDVTDELIKRYNELYRKTKR